LICFVPELLIESNWSFYQSQVLEQNKSNWSFYQSEVLGQNKTNQTDHSINQKFCDWYNDQFDLFCSRTCDW
jgi:hypothetical protein